MSTERRSPTPPTLARRTEVSDSESPPGVPRWVKVFGVVTVIVILLAIVVMILAGGKHGSGRHLHRAHAVVSQFASTFGA